MHPPFARPGLHRHQAQLASGTGLAKASDYFSEQARAYRLVRQRALVARVQADPDTYLVEVNLRGLAKFNHDHGHHAGDALIERWAPRVVATLDPDIDAVAHSGSVTAAVSGLEEARELRAKMLMYGNTYADGHRCWAFVEREGLYEPVGR